MWGVTAWAHLLIWMLLLVMVKSPGTEVTIPEIAFTTPTDSTVPYLLMYVLSLGYTHKLEGLLGSISEWLVFHKQTGRWRR